MSGLLGAYSVIQIGRAPAAWAIPVIEPSNVLGSASIPPL